MRPLVLLLLSVELGGAFGGATVTGHELTTTTMEIEVVVEVEGTGSVVAHLIDPGGDQQTLALADRGGGRFGGVAEVRRVNLVVVFEIIGARQAIESLPVNLTTLGLDPAVLGVNSGAEPVSSPGGISDENQRWGWAALGLAAAALALLAYWALPERRWKSDEEIYSEEVVPPSPS